MTTVEQALREALEWALKAGGWRLIYLNKPVPPAVATDIKRPLEEPGRINDAYLDSLRSKL